MIQTTPPLGITIWLNMKSGKDSTPLLDGGNCPYPGKPTTRSAAGAGAKPKDKGAKKQPPKENQVKRAPRAATEAHPEEAHPEEAPKDIPGGLVGCEPTGDDGTGGSSKSDAGSISSEENSTQGEASSVSGDSAAQESMSSDGGGS